MTVCSKKTENDIAKRLSEARMRLLFLMPFYGNLLMHLNFSLANCKTAATDMKKIYFDPEFVGRLSDKELEFVLLHEVMHCALLHCQRGKNLINDIFNIACDIVVNSNIMYSFGVTDFQVDGEDVMHKTPDGKEGYLYSAEKVYEMLLKNISDMPDTIDDHSIWSVVPDNPVLSDTWKKNLIDAGNNAGNGLVPPGPRMVIDGYKHRYNLNWCEILHDFICMVCDRYDFSFQPPDRRFQGQDFILPAFFEEYDEVVKNIWFLVDTSGSVSGKMLTTALNEIKYAIEQFESLSGILSFFDTSVTPPVNFNGVEDIEKAIPAGNGGTLFSCIFKYLEEHMSENAREDKDKYEFPAAIIVLTDGYSVYPDESAAMGVPVLWIIADNNDSAPWGTTIHVNSNDYF